METTKLYEQCRELINVNQVNDAENLLKQALENGEISEFDIIDFFEDRACYDKAIYWLMNVDGDVANDIFINDWIDKASNRPEMLEATKRCESFTDNVNNYLSSIDGHEICDLKRFPYIEPYTKYCYLAQDKEMLEQYIEYIFCWSEVNTITEIVKLAISRSDDTFIIDLLQRIREISKYNKDIWYALANCLIYKGQKEDALPYLKYTSEHKGKWKQEAKDLLLKTYPEKQSEKAVKKTRKKSSKKKSFKSRLYHLLKKLFK